MTDTKSLTLIGKVALAADVLSEYSHLPPFENVLIGQSGRVYPLLSTRSDEDGMRGIALWAEAFGASLDVDAAKGRVKTRFEVSGFEMRIEESADPKFVAGLLGPLYDPYGVVVRLSPAQMLAALDTRAGAS